MTIFRKGPPKSSSTASDGKSEEAIKPPLSNEGARAKDADDDEVSPKEGDGSVPVDATPPPISKLLWLARPEFPGLALALVLMIANEASGLYLPILIADAYDYLVDPDLDDGTKRSLISRTMIIVIAIHVAGMVAGFVRGAIMGAAGERVVARLRNSLYSAILRQDVSFFDEHKTGELVSRLGSDTTLIQQATSLAVPEVVLGATKLATCVGLMFWISAELAGVVLGLCLFEFAVCVPFGKKIGALSKEYQDALGEAQNRSTEALGAMRTVQSFAAEDRERRRYSERIGDPGAFRFWIPDAEGRKTTYGVGFWKSIWGTGFFTFLFGFGFGSMHVALWYGFKLVIGGKITLGGLTAFQSYIFQIGGGLGTVSRYVTQLIEAHGASGRVFYLLERIPAIPAEFDGSQGSSSGDETEKKTGSEGSQAQEHVKTDEEGGDQPPSALSMAPLKPTGMDGAISFQEVDFAYPSRLDVPVLKNFNLEVPPNTTAAIVGSSGAGKSTVVALLQRFYDVNGGGVKIDGNDIRSLDLKWMRQHIGFVQQEPQLFGMTVGENVCYGVDRDDVTDDEVEAVCREANAHDFVARWPQKYDTMVGERGVKLSGGQKQRLAIARALLTNPKILLLDEATSALDAESEHLVQQAIDRAMVGRTVVIVAHRLSTIKDADQIVVLDEHRIADVGTHDKLMRRCSKYQDLIRRQTAGKVELKDTIQKLHQPARRSTSPLSETTTEE
mmetsp:Transcript_39931/g.81516  ORF Transcript_39931/g.81516 Transcript_39931/m.81516 type:complete len:728 (-) Transcript_39931:293-2476(-)